MADRSETSEPNPLTSFHEVLGAFLPRESRQDKINRYLGTLLAWAILTMLTVVAVGVFVGVAARIWAWAL